MMNSETSSTTDPKKEPERLYKVAFDLPEKIAEWANASTERLWAGKTPVSMEVQIRNVPFYVKGISFDDTVRVRADNERRELVFDSFVSESGHSTVRIIIKEDAARQEIEDLLVNLECSWEIDSTGYLWAIDIPPHVAYTPIRTALIREMNRNKIGVEEGAVAGAHRRE